MVCIPIGDTESFGFCEGDKLYFTAWYEDPEYREETVVRALQTEAILERFPGDIWIMPNGDKWHLKLVIGRWRGSYAVLHKGMVQADAASG